MPTGKPNSTPEERFLSRIDFVPCKYPELGECHMWIGGQTSNGYAQVKKISYQTVFGHQYACHRWNNSPLPVEKGMEVSHRCDTKLCVNPAHLVYQTKLENMMDMYERNPTAFGRKPPTEEELEILRQCITDKTPRRETARLVAHDRDWVDRIVRDYL